MTSRAFITGIAGYALTGEEKSFLKSEKPWGFILFKRNIKSPDQVKALVEELRATLGNNAPILIDQEGGRVQRLGPPDWPVYPPGAVYDRLYRTDQSAGLKAARLGARLIASDLNALGIDVDCLPLADVPTADGDPVIGDRAYGHEPQQVSAVARAVADGLLAGGVLPVLKHIPGHGRATADSHHKLPVVDAAKMELEQIDFAAFKPLADLPMAMTAHVVFSAIDPIAPATTSATMVREVIRAAIGFEGLLMSDDVSMNALSGSIAERSKASFAAGCDVVLHCNGKLDEMRAVASASPELSGQAKVRAERALAQRRTPEAIDIEEARRAFAAMIAGDAAAKGLVI
jgi:beta-N-acetylhexosaminidase